MMTSQAFPIASPLPKVGNTADVLVEGCVVSGAKDAGIYVGQSRDIIVRNNEVFHNVAGIEIENSTGADVYGNTAAGNTGGILVFNMPNLPVPGSKTRVFKNAEKGRHHLGRGRYVADA